MLTRLPVEIIDQITGYLSSDDIGSIACTCSALRLPAHLQLFRTIQMRIREEKEDEEGVLPQHTDFLLSYPHLLKYASRLTVNKRCWTRRRPRNVEAISVHVLWSHLPTMHRLTYIELELNPCHYA